MNPKSRRSQRKYRASKAASSPPRMRSNSRSSDSINPMKHQSGRKVRVYRPVSIASFAAKAGTCAAPAQSLHRWMVMPTDEELRQKLDDVTHALRPVHKALVDLTSADYERRHGRIGGPVRLVQLLKQDPFFPLLHPMSAPLGEIREVYH